MLLLFSYNAPEVLDQKLYPIDRENLQKCDIWAFGLLLWEICIGGAEYLTKFNEDTSSISPDKFRKLAKASIPGRKQLGAAMFLEIALHRTLQDNPAQRAKSMEDIPLFTKLQFVNPDINPWIYIGGSRRWLMTFV